MKVLLRLLVPGGLAIGSAALFVFLRDADPELALLTGRYAVVLYGAGALLAAAFHRSRVVTALVAFACIQIFTGTGESANPDLSVGFATLLMGLLGILAVLRDRGITSGGGVAQLSGAALLGVICYLLSREPDRAAELLAMRFLPLAPSAESGVPDWTALMGGAALLVAIYGALRWRGPVERAFFWALVAVMVSLAPALSAPEAAFLMMCAGLVLSVSVLETSYFMAYRDELTGLPARRALMQELDDIGGTYTLAMVDVDHFKQCNDKHGHDVGDQVLQLVAKHLAAGPGGGKAFRYGGEEFTLVYPGRVRDDALPHADAVRQSVEDATFSLRAWNRPRKKPKDGKEKKRKKKRRTKKLSVTISVGLADSTGKSSAPADVLKQADTALYRAKRNGRNRVEE